MIYFEKQHQIFGVIILIIIISFLKNSCHLFQLMILYCLSNLNDAVGWCLDILVDGDATDFVRHNESRSRVLDVRHLSLDVSFQCGILKHAVAVFSKGAVLDDEVVRIAKHLFARDVAVHQS